MRLGSDTSAGAAVVNILRVNLGRGVSSLHERRSSGLEDLFCPNSSSGRTTHSYFSWDWHSHQRQKNHSNLRTK